MTTTEPEWDDQTRSWALALEHNRNSLCPCGCGFPAVVSQAPENEGRFGMEPPVRCHARMAIVLGRKQYDDESVAVPEALLFDQPILR